MSTTILNPRTKKVWILIVCTSYVYLSIPMFRRNIYVFTNHFARVGCDTRSIFWVVFKRFEFSVFFLLDRLSLIKSPVHLRWRENNWIQTFYQGYLKCKQPRPGLEHGLLCSFPMIIAIALSAPLSRVYIYIYSHPQTDCFVLSELFSVVRHAGRSKPESKPIQFYVRLSLRPLGQQADQRGIFF